MSKDAGSLTIYFSDANVSRLIKRAKDITVFLQQEEENKQSVWQAEVKKQTFGRLHVHVYATVD